MEGDKKELLRGIPDEIRGTGIERLFLEAQEDGHMPMWVTALKSDEQLAEERLELLRAEQKKTRRLEKENRRLLERLASAG
jgi:hypothetical protein